MDFYTFLQVIIPKVSVASQPKFELTSRHHSKNKEEKYLELFVKI